MSAVCDAPRAKIDAYNTIVAEYDTAKSDYVDAVNASQNRVLTPEQRATLDTMGADERAKWFKMRDSYFAFPKGCQDALASPYR